MKLLELLLRFLVAEVELAEDATVATHLGSLGATGTTIRGYMSFRGYTGLTVVGALGQRGYTELMVLALGSTGHRRTWILATSRKTGLSRHTGGTAAQLISKQIWQSTATALNNNSNRLSLRTCLG